ncbi:MAG: glycoside hydrolase family 16 protein [Clostridiales bacterium]|jgi:hypothetical protein|nr:glycoside hydrolase family 16 protein [Clostridiales bacterium]
MKKKILSALVIVLLIVAVMGGGFGAFLLVITEKGVDLPLDGYSYPLLLKANGWEETMNVDFSTITSLDDLAAAHWFPTKHGLRKEEYWCPDMIDFSDAEALIIHSEKSAAHVCSDDKCPLNGIFTGGIETRSVAGGSDVPFTQAFGYFEAEVQVPTGTGMWSAFWLQSDNMGRVGDQGKDGSEIDIYESSFIKNPTFSGNALHYDTYEWPRYQSYGKVSDTKVNLYDGQYHRYGLLWTPEEYVFFVDGVPVWATAFGGVSRTAEYLRLTVEIRTGGIGPYGQDIGEFENRADGSNDFKIKSVVVYQNDSFKSEIRTYA